MDTEVTIIDQGRGPQLSTSRITVQDLVPYFQLGYTHEQIRDVMPTLSPEEIRAVEHYIEDHREEVMEEDRRIRVRSAGRKNPPEVEEILRQARSERLARMELSRQQRHEDRNGESPPC
jgi:uncharacterized protein (DUF433 family)